MNDSILKRLAKIEQNAIDIDKLETRMARMEAQIQSMGMVAAPEIPEDVREFLLIEQRQDENETEMQARLIVEFRDIMHRNEMDALRDGDLHRLEALQRALKWFGSA